MALDEKALEQVRIVNGSLQLLNNILSGLLDLRSAEQGTF